MEFQGRTFSGKTQIDWDSIRVEAENYPYFSITVRKTKSAASPKTKKQLGAIFGLMISNAIEQANDLGLDTSSFLKELIREDLPSGIGLSKDFLKEILYCLCPMYRDGKRITLGHASTIETAKFFDDCRKLLAGHGIDIPEPDPEYRSRLC